MTEDYANFITIGKVPDTVDAWKAAASEYLQHLDKEIDAHRVTSWQILKLREAYLRAIETANDHETNPRAPVHTVEEYFDVSPEQVQEIMGNAKHR